MDITFVQEWLLSPRVLHIQSMTVWNCFESQGNELEKRFFSPSFITRSYGDYYYWNKIVGDYTSRQITKEKDRLPALAGRAERHRAQTGDVYLTGLWLEALPQSLMWIRRRSEPMRKPLTYRAPGVGLPWKERSLFLSREMKG